MVNLTNGMSKAAFRQGINTNIADLNEAKIDKDELEEFLPEIEITAFVDTIWPALQAKLAAEGYVPGTVITPSVSNLFIGGTPTQGQVLSASYSFSGGTEQNSTRKWYRADNNAGLNRVLISGATTGVYTLQLADVGKRIQFSITPRNSAGTLGQETFSDYSSEINAVVGDSIVEVVVWDTMGSVVATGNDLTATNYDGNSRAISTAFLPIGSTGFVQALASGRIALAASDGLDGDNELDHAIWRDSGNGKIVCRTEIGAVFFSDDITGRPETTICRLRADGVNINYEYSINNGTSWILAKTAPQDAFILRVKATLSGGNVLDVKQSGLTNA